MAKHLPRSSPATQTEGQKLAAYRTALASAHNQQQNSPGGQGNLPSKNGAVLGTGRRMLMTSL